MTIDRFWETVEQSLAPLEDPKNQHRRLQQLLEKQTLEDILEFDRIFWGYSKLSNIAKLWAAFYIKDGGCSDDGFTYCRYALIAAGRKIFDELVRDPEQLANPNYAHLRKYEMIGAAAGSAYETVSGTGLKGYIAAMKASPPFDMTGEYMRLGLDPAYRLGDDPVIKLKFGDAEAMAKLLPKVWEQYGRR